jgi:hypothetical protein
MGPRFRSKSAIGTIAIATVLMFGVAERTALAQDHAAREKIQPALKTPWRTPDLQGAWSNTIVVPFERAKEFDDRQFMTDAEYKQAVTQLLQRNKTIGRDSRESGGKDIRGTEEDVARAYNEHWFGDKPTEVGRRTSMIIDPPDGRMPAFTPEAQARITQKREYLAAQGDPETANGDRLIDPYEPGGVNRVSSQVILERDEREHPATAAERAAALVGPSPDFNLDRMNRADGPEDRSNRERCLTDGLPVILQAGPLTPDGRPVGDFGGVMRIIQSADSVDIYYDIGQGTGFNRPIPITNRPHLPANIRQFYGDSVAHWEGDTLVVDVTNFTEKTNFLGSRQNLHLIERYKRIDAKTLQITITADDPTTWVRPFTFVEELKKNADKPNMVYEGGCHEGNYGLLDMLASTRAAEKAFAEGKGPNPEAGRLH